jgi:hypothetical protein
MVVLVAHGDATFVETLGTRDAEPEYTPLQALARQAMRSGSTTAFAAHVAEDVPALMQSALSAPGDGDNAWVLSLLAAGERLTDRLACLIESDPER